MILEITYVYIYFNILEFIYFDTINLIEIILGQ